MRRCLLLPAAAPNSHLDATLPWCPIWPFSPKQRSRLAILDALSGERWLWKVCRVFGAPFRPPYKNVTTIKFPRHLRVRALPQDLTTAPSHFLPRSASIEEGLFSPDINSSSHHIQLHPSSIAIMSSTQNLNPAKEPSPTRANGPGRSTGYRPHQTGMIAVEPPRREDLQPSYAQVLHGDDAAAHSWYGAMSMSHACSRFSLRLG